MALNARKLLEMEQGQFQKNLRGTESLLQNRLRLLGNVIQELQDTFDRHRACSLSFRPLVFHSVVCFGQRQEGLGSPSSSGIAQSPESHLPWKFGIRLLR